MATVDWCFEVDRESDVGEGASGECGDEGGGRGLGRGPG